MAANLKDVDTLINDAAFRVRVTSAIRLRARLVMAETEPDGQRLSLARLALTNVDGCVNQFLVMLGTTTAVTDAASPVAGSVDQTLVAESMVNNQVNNHWNRVAGLVIR